MKLLNFTLILLMIVAGLSCKDDDEKPDTTKPTITLNSPTSNKVVPAGDNLNVDAILSDDVELQEYVLTIAYSGSQSVKNVVEFTFNSYTDTDANGNPLPSVIGKKTATLNFDIAIADNARAGNYTFSISVKDKSGNGTEKTVQFVISRP